MTPRFPSCSGDGERPDVQHHAHAVRRGLLPLRQLPADHELRQPGARRAPSAEPPQRPRHDRPSLQRPRVDGTTRRRPVPRRARHRLGHRALRRRRRRRRVPAARGARHPDPRPAHRRAPPGHRGQQLLVVPARLRLRVLLPSAPSAAVRLRRAAREALPALPGLLRVPATTSTPSPSSASASRRARPTGSRSTSTRSSASSTSTSTPRSPTTTSGGWACRCATSCPREARRRSRSTPAATCSTTTRTCSSSARSAPWRRSRRSTGPRSTTPNTAAPSTYRPSLAHRTTRCRRVSYDREERSQLAVTQGRYTEEHFVTPHRELLERWAAAGAAVPSL